MPTTQTPDAQKRAMAREDSHGTPYERTKAEVRDEADRLADRLGLRRGAITVSTWLGAHGDAYCLHFDSRSDGERISVHRWHSTGEVEVRRIFGSFWRPRAGREGILRAEARSHADDGIAGILAAIQTLDSSTRKDG